VHTCGLAVGVVVIVVVVVAVVVIIGIVVDSFVKILMWSRLWW